MSYMALYRKWRPTTFDDMVGQEPIVTVLKNQIALQRIGHAYLFCGTRGTGKTTAAKIFAKAVNCKSPVDGSPCGVCESCLAADSGASMNIVEIDAASNNGVDNIRQIREEVQYSPTKGRYRVYIIDEAHMLSGGAFNALLKTLEEPPSYVIFILATTEAHKIPVTVLSRCQRYDFRRIPANVIAQRLERICAAENVAMEDRALRYISLRADGAMRDAISLLDECIPYAMGGKITYDIVLDALGASDSGVSSLFLRAVASCDTTRCLSIIAEASAAGRDLMQFTQDFIWYMRNLLLLKTSHEAEDITDISKEDMERYCAEAGLISEDALVRLIKDFSSLYNSMRTATNRRIDLEMAAVVATRPQMASGDGALAARVGAIEKILEGMPAHGISSGQLTGGRLSDDGRPSDFGNHARPEKTENIQDSAAVAGPDKGAHRNVEDGDYENAVRDWRRLCAKVGQPGQNILEDAVPTLAADGLVVNVFSNFVYNCVKSAKLGIGDRLAAAFEEMYGTRPAVTFRLEKKDAVCSGGITAADMEPFKTDIEYE